MTSMQLFRMMDLRENGFGLDTEMTAKILQLGLRPFEIPVTYHSRSFAHGKKLSWRHGVECLWVLARVRFGRRPRPVLRDAVFAEPNAADDTPAIEAELDLAETTAALHRIDQGTYGRCERCDAALGRQRLMALPAARYCWTCAAAARAS